MDIRIPSRLASGLATAALCVLSVAGIAAAPLALPGVLDYRLQYRSGQAVSIPYEDVPLASGPEADESVGGDVLAVEPDMSKTHSTPAADFDASLCRAGILSVTCKLKTDDTVKCVLTHPDGNPYTYDIRPGVPAVFTLTGGDGKYSVKIMQHTTGKKYRSVASWSFEAEGILEDAMYVQSCLYIDYRNAEDATGLAESLSGTELETVDAIYQYVARHVEYDKEKARTVSKIYAPDLDSTLSSGKGICMDYAALTAGMLRSEGVPCRMLFGDLSNSTYHAWIEVYSEDGGWLDESGVYLEPGEWTRLDPTMAHSAIRNPVAGNRFVANDKNYDAPKYVY